jgi:uncharacterized membrane protein
VKKQSCYQRLVSVEEIAEAEESRPPGTYFIRENTNSYYIKWFYRANNQQKNFRISYRVNSAVSLHEDAAELYWQLVGDKWGVEQQNIAANFNLPLPIEGDEVRAWAHGPLSGAVAIPSPTTVVYNLDRLPAENFFEARIIMPRDWFSGGALGFSSKEEIISQEQEFINETIDKPSKARAHSISCCWWVGVTNPSSDLFFN